MTDPNTEIEALRGEAAARAKSRARGYFWRGVLALALGLVALFWPQQSLALLIRLAGIVLILDGIATVFFTRNSRGMQAEIGAGVLAPVIGVVLLFLPAASARLAFVLIGIWALITGASYLITWFKLPKGAPDRADARNAGIVALLAGLVLVIWPGTGMVLTAWGLGIAAFVIAATMFFLAARFRDARRAFSDGG